MAKRRRSRRATPLEAGGVSRLQSAAPLRSKGATRELLSAMQADGVDSKLVDELRRRLHLTAS